MCLLHQIQYMWNFIMYSATVHIITITQHYNIAQRVVCTISQPSKVSAQIIIALLFKSLTVSDCIYLTLTMDQLLLFTSVSVSLTVFFLSLFQLYYRAAKAMIICADTAYQHIPTCHIPTRWEYDMMIRGGNVTLSYSHHIYYIYHYMYVWVICFLKYIAHVWSFKLFRI